ncbi:MAG: hypothetical protein JWR83_2663 [Aeromicrobium sp.]|nr:hypothetical protein [Aeromicrobium sp.]
MVDLATDELSSSAPRFVVELIAWVASPLALWSHSVVLAIASVVVLIGVPTLIGMPGVKNQRPAVAVGPVAAIAVELIQPVAAVISSVAVWSWLVGVGVLVLSLAMLVLQLPRWRWMLRRRSRAKSPETHTVPPSNV